MKEEKLPEFEYDLAPIIGGKPNAAYNEVREICKEYDDNDVPTGRPQLSKQLELEIPLHKDAIPVLPSRELTEDEKKDNYTGTVRLYVTRHSTARQNNQEKRLKDLVKKWFPNKDESERRWLVKSLRLTYFGPECDDLIDPPLDKTSGAARVEKLAQCYLANGGPSPDLLFTSPSDRCVETMVRALKGAGAVDPKSPFYAKFQPGGCYTIHVREGLREWTGVDHNHSSDERSSRTEIQKRFNDHCKDPSITIKNLVKLDFGDLDEFPEEDEKFAKYRRTGEKTREPYGACDARVERVVDEMFAMAKELMKQDPTKVPVVWLYLHNQSARAAFRVFGFRGKAPTPAENGCLAGNVWANSLLIPSIMNAAKTGVVLRQKRLDQKQRKDKGDKLKKRKDMETTFLVAENDWMQETADKGIKDMAEKSFQELLEFTRGEHQVTPEQGENKVTSMQKVRGTPPPPPPPPSSS